MGAQSYTSLTQQRMLEIFSIVRVLFVLKFDIVICIAAGLDDFQLGATVSCEYLRRVAVGLCISVTLILIGVTMRTVGCRRFLSCC
jgi:hypothetical protein